MIQFNNVDTEKPYAQVEQVSRYAWQVSISHGAFRYGAGDGYGWHRRTKERARRKGVRELERYNRKYGKLDKGFKLQ